MKYNIYAGLGGSFGGLRYKGTIDLENHFLATEYARTLAIEEYEAYEGLYGIVSREDFCVIPLLLITEGGGCLWAHF